MCATEKCRDNDSGIGPLVEGCDLFPESFFLLKLELLFESNLAQTSAGPWPPVPRYKHTPMQSNIRVISWKESLHEQNTF